MNHERNANNMYELQFPSPEVTQPGKHGPTLIVALEGYADAGQAIESGAKHLLGALEHHTLVSFNNDELIDYRARRPAVTLDNNSVAGMENISLEINVLRDNAGTPFLLLSGPEPDMRWNAFTQAISDLIEKFDVEQTICLYAAPMTVPHTRPLIITAHGNSAELLGNNATIDAMYMVPGSASLQLERQLHKQGRNVVGYTAHVPHYLAASPYPEATLSLLKAVANSSSLSLPLKSLEVDSSRTAAQVEQQIADSPEIQQVVHALEHQYDEEIERYRKAHPNAILSGDDETIPSGEQLGDEFERYLAQFDKDVRGHNDQNKDE